MTYIQYAPSEDKTYCGTYNQHGVFIREKGYYFTTHAKDQCAGEWCSIHNPNPMWEFGRLFWRSDRGIMERICEHGVGHPTKESWAFLVRVGGAKFAEAEMVHGCDGCCA